MSNTKPVAQKHASVCVCVSGHVAMNVAIAAFLSKYAQLRHCRYRQPYTLTKD